MTGLTLAVGTDVIIQSLVNGLIFGLILAFVAGGLALIWGVVDIVNFAHGEYMLVAMYVTFFASSMMGLDPLVMLPVNAILLFLLGVLTHQLVFSKLMDESILSQVLASFGILLVIRYGALTVIGPSTYQVRDYSFSGTISVAGLVISTGELITGLLSLVFIGVLFLILRYTKTGKGIRAVSQDVKAARVVGINPDRMYAATWGLGLSTVGVAGTMVATFFPIQPTLTPAVWTLFSFAAVALGGFGSVFGAIVGGIIISVVRSTGAVMFDPSFKLLYVYAVFFAALIVLPEGIINWRRS
jgi:branched-chain amino acid transport system permease protein